jgi:hypothetical protein
MDRKTSYRILKSNPQLVNENFFRFFLSVFSTKKYVCTFMTQCTDNVPKNKCTDEGLRQKLTFPLFIVSH